MAFILLCCLVICEALSFLVRDGKEVDLSGRGGGRKELGRVEGQETAFILYCKRENMFHKRGRKTVKNTKSCSTRKGYSCIRKQRLHEIIVIALSQDID